MRLDRKISRGLMRVQQVERQEESVWARARSLAWSSGGVIWSLLFWGLTSLAAIVYWRAESSDWSEALDRSNLPLGLLPCLALSQIIWYGINCVRALKVQRDESRLQRDANAESVEMLAAHKLRELAVRVGHGNCDGLSALVRSATAFPSGWHGAGDLVYFLANELNLVEEVGGTDHLRLSQEQEDIARKHAARILRTAIVLGVVVKEPDAHIGNVLHFGSYVLTEFGRRVLLIGDNGSSIRGDLKR